MHLIEILSRAHAKGGGGGGGDGGGGGRGGSLNNFRFRTFIGHFPSDGAASLAVKGLIVCAVFPCVPTMPVFGIFNMRTDIMQTIARGGFTDSVRLRESALKPRFWKQNKNPLRHWGLEPAS